MWTKVWLVAGRESDLRAPGDYLTLEVGVESIIVVRRAAGGLAAHHMLSLRPVRFDTWEGLHADAVPREGGVT